MTRPPVPLMPTGWRPRNPRKLEKAAIMLRQGGRCWLTGQKIMAGDKIEYHHDPELREREWDDAKQDTIPSGADIDYIHAVLAPEHRKVTATGKKRQAKTKRVRTAEAEHQARMQNKCGDARKLTRSIPSRGWPKPKAKRKSR